MILTLVRTEPVTADVTSFIFSPDRPVQWKPGQYFHYDLPHPQTDGRGDERWFTNSAAPFEKHLMISTRLTSKHGSSFKRALLELIPGEQLEAEGPEGDFTVEDFSRNYVFIAGGIGITPFRSILAEAHNQRKQPKVTLLYANRTNDIPFKTELDQIAADNLELRIHYIVLPERLSPETIKQHADAVENPLVYISGPEPMVKYFAAQLREMGITEANIKIDDFPGYEAD